MKNIVISILGAVSLVSIGAVAWLLATPPSVDPRVVKLETELKEARQAIAKLKAELVRKASPPAPLAIMPKASETEASASAPDATAQQPSLREMLATPSMRAMMEQQQVAQIEVGYAQLFEQLQLSPEEKEHFKSLLIARQKMQTELGLQLMDPNLSEAKRAELMAEAKHQSSVYDATIKSFLNDDNDWVSYKSWENTQPERSQYNAMGRSLFSASGEPLSNQQEDQLLKLMSDVRLSPSSVGGLNDQTGTDPNKLTDEVIEQQMEQLASNKRIIYERSAEFLTAGQRQTLNAYLDQMMSVSKSGIEISKMILRGTNQ